MSSMSVIEVRDTILGLEVRLFFLSHMNELKPISMWAIGVGSACKPILVCQTRPCRVLMVHSGMCLYAPS